MSIRIGIVLDSAAAVTASAWMLVYAHSVLDKLVNAPGVLKCISKAQNAGFDMRIAVWQEDLERVRVAGDGRVDVTVGSALDIFGGQLPYQEVVAWHRRQSQQ